MRAMNARPKLTRAGLLFAIWTAYGVFSACQNHFWYAAGSNPVSWGWSFRYEMIYAYLCGVWTPAILWLSGRFRIDRDHLARHLLIHLAAMTAFVVVTKTVFEFVAGPAAATFV